MVNVDEFTKAIEQRAGHLEADLHAVLVADIEQRPLDLLTHVPRNPIRGVRAVQRPLVDRHVLGQLVQLRSEPLGDEPLVDSGTQLRHTSTLRQDGDRVAPTGPSAGANWMLRFLSSPPDDHIRRRVGRLSSRRFWAPRPTTERRIRARSL